MKILTKKQKQAEVKRQIKQELQIVIKNKLLEKVDKALNSGAIPDHWLEENNRLLLKSIIDSFCKDGNYSFFEKQTVKDSNNLHLFL